MDKPLLSDSCQITCVHLIKHAVFHLTSAVMRAKLEILALVLAPSVWSGPSRWPPCPCGRWRPTSGPTSSWWRRCGRGYGWPAYGRRTSTCSAKSTTLCSSCRRTSRRPAGSCVPPSLSPSWPSWCPSAGWGAQTAAMMTPGVRMWSCWWAGVCSWSLASPLFFPSAGPLTPSSETSTTRCGGGTEAGDRTGAVSGLRHIHAPPDHGGDTAVPLRPPTQEGRGGEEAVHRSGKGQGGNEHAGTDTFFWLVPEQSVRLTDRTDSLHFSLFICFSF